jgi:hypothetical protein
MAMHRTRTAPFILVFVSIAGVLAACSDETRDETREAAESAGDDLDQVVDEGSARAVAEALRAAIESDDDYDDSGQPTVAVINDNVADLPGDPQVEGVADADGDGFDDDGAVDVRVDDEGACLRLNDGSIDVENGACDEG